MQQSLSRRTLAVLYLFGSLGNPCQAAGAISSIEEIRAPQTRYHPPVEGQIELVLRDEAYLRSDSCKILLTSHVGSSHVIYPGYLLRLWRAVDLGFELLEEQSGHGEVVVERFSVEGRELFFVQDVMATAGANWVATVLFYIGSDCSLGTVEFDPAEACGVELPHLTFESSFRGSVYSLEDSGVRFSNALWCPGDSPNFPTRGQLEGSLGIRADENGELVAQVSECRREERFCEP